MVDDLSQGASPGTSPNPAVMLERMGDETRLFLAAGLKDAHAMENQALSIIKPQLDRITGYPAVAEKLKTHVEETEAQKQRLERILDEMGESPSGAKDTMLSVGGTLASFGHTVAPDEIIKQSLANHAFEHYEIAAYLSLISVCEAAGLEGACALLKESLLEERAMANWLEDNIGSLTLKYLERRESGADAKN